MDRKQKKTGSKHCFEPVFFNTYEEQITINDELIYYSGSNPRIILNLPNSANKPFSKFALGLSNPRP